MAATMAISAPSVRPFMLSSRPSLARKGVAARPMYQRGRNVAPRASAVDVGMQIAQEASKVGTVDAPSWVLPAGIVVVTLGSILSGYLLKPGDDAAKEIQERDARSGRFKK